jgi:hypothetical protein
MKELEEEACIQDKLECSFQPRPVLLPLKIRW